MLVLAVLYPSYRRGFCGSISKLMVWFLAIQYPGYWRGFLLFNIQVIGVGSCC